MSISDSRPEEMLRTRTYRAAVWSARITYAWELVWVVLLFARSSGGVLVLTWLVGVPLSVITVVLLRRCGARFVRRRRYWFIDREIQRQFYRDVLWLPRRQPRV